MTDWGEANKGITTKNIYYYHGNQVTIHDG